MSGITLALLAQFIIGVSIVIDKAFLKERKSGNVFAYVFWMGVFNLVTLLVLPFGFIEPSLNEILLSLFIGVMFVLALVFYYTAIERGEISNTAALFGGIGPLATLLVGNVFFITALTSSEKIAFGFMTIGGLLMFLTDKTRFRQTIFWVVMASLSFAFVSVFEKHLFNGTNFLTGFAMIRFGVFLSSMAMLLVPVWRKQIFTRTLETSKKSRWYYLFNRALAGIGSVLISYSISLDHPALINATEGFRYVTIFILAIFLSVWIPRLLRENFSRWVVVGKTVAVILIILGSTLLIFQRYYENQPVPEPAKISWGVTFSQKMSQDLGLNWRNNYLAILDELKPSGLRLVAYWDLLEPKDGIYEFKDLDWQMEQAKNRNIPVILTIGQKVPRWPECHYPAWLDVDNRETRENELTQYLAAIVGRYKNFPNLKYWQVENEPYVIFGNCKPGVTRFLEKEVTFVRSQDQMHPIILTDGGEWGGWYPVARLGDAFGTTLYRKVSNRIFGAMSLYFTPEYYSFKRDMVKKMVGKSDQPFLVIEAGMEPWGQKQIYEMSPEEQIRHFTIEEFFQNLDFARQTRFDQIYLWGVEWWYYQKLYGDSSYWLKIQETFSGGQKLH